MTLQPSVFQKRYHDLIHDENELRVAASLFLTAIDSKDKDDNVMMLSVFARDKYMEEKMPVCMNACIKKVVLRQSNADEFVKEVKRLESRVGSYTFHHKQQSYVLQDAALVVILSLNTASMRAAHMALHQEVMNDWTKQNSRVKDPHKMVSEFHSLIHSDASKSKTVMDIDIDTKDQNHLALIADQWFLNADVSANLDNLVVAMIETTNGYHLVMRRKGLNKKQHENLYHVLSKTCWNFSEKNRLGVSVNKKFISKNEGAGVPLPGTYQGRFPVRFVNYKNIFNIATTCHEPWRLNLE
jgi:hypothetical protein